MISDAYFLKEGGSSWDCYFPSLELLAAGAYATVYVGVPSSKEKHMVLKVATSSTGAHLLSNEAKVLSHLGTHPNICNFLMDGEGLVREGRISGYAKAQVEFLGSNRAGPVQPSA